MLYPLSSPCTLGSEGDDLLYLLGCDLEGMVPDATETLLFVCHSKNQRR